MTGRALGIIAFAALAFAVAAPAAASPKHWMLWRDGSDLVPGLDGFKKLGASNWHPTGEEVVADPALPDPLTLEKGHALIEGARIEDDKRDWF